MKMTQLVLTVGQSLNGSSDQLNHAMVQQTVEACQYHIQSASIPEGNKKYDTLELYFAGSKQLMNGTAGKQRPDYEKDWSTGEHYFGRVIQRIGLDKFSPPGFGNKTQCQLKATLMTDYNTLRRDCSSSADKGSALVNNSNNKLEQQIHQAANMCHDILQRKKSPPITHATVVLPFLMDEITDSTTTTTISEQERDLLKQNTLEMARTVIQQSWQQNHPHDSLLSNATVQFVLVEAIHETPKQQ